MKTAYLVNEEAHYKFAIISFSKCEKLNFQRRNKKSEI